MSDGPTRKIQVLPWAVCGCAGILGIALGPSLDERTQALAGRPHVSVARVLVTESVVPPCAPVTSRTRDLLVVTGHMPRETARAVASASIRSGPVSWEVSREGKRCTVSSGGRERDEACLVESCSEDICALRIPLDAAAASGEVSVRYADAGGRDLGGGAASPGPAPSGSPPELDVRRDGAAVEIRAGGGEETPGRVTLLRGGVAVADAPLRYDSPGLARISVPEPADGLVVALSTRGAEGVIQASAHLDGPFDGGCGPSSDHPNPGPR